MSRADRRRANRAAGKLIPFYSNHPVAIARAREMMAENPAAPWRAAIGAAAVELILQRCEFLPVGFNLEGSPVCIGKCPSCGGRWTAVLEICWPRFSCDTCDPKAVHGAMRRLGLTAPPDYAAMRRGEP